MSAPNAVFEAFSLSLAAILDGATSFASFNIAGMDEDEEIYGVNDASLEPDTDSFDNEGNDAVLSTWNWLNKAEVNVEAGYISFPTISRMTERPYTSSGAGDNVMFEMDLWHEDSMNVGAKPMIIRMPSKDNRGNIRLLDIGLYRVDFMPITFEGPSYKEGLKCSYGGTAVFSRYDELGVAFPDNKKRVGKLISRSLASA